MDVDYPSAPWGTVDRLYAKLRDGVYEPIGAKHGTTTLPNGKVRHHAIPSVEDAIVHRALAITWRPAWRRIHPGVFGGRPGCDPREVVSRVRRQLEERSKSWVFKWDIQAAFATAPRSIALERLRTLTQRDDLADSLSAWYRRQGSRFPGLIEGCSVAPLLLATLTGPDVMEPLCKVAPGALLWVDDGAVVFPAYADAISAKHIVESALAKLGMRLHPEKTVVVEHDRDAVGQAGWDLLGHEFQARRVVPSRDNRSTLVRAVADACSRGHFARARKAIAAWAGWFAHCDAAEDVFAQVDLDITRAVPDGEGLPSVREVAARAREALGTPRGGVRAGPHRRRKKKKRASGQKGKDLRNSSYMVLEEWRPHPRGKQRRPRVRKSRAFGVADPGVACDSTGGVLKADRGSSGPQAAVATCPS